MQSIKEKIIGAWKLDKISLFDENHQPQEDYFANAIGMIMYDRSGMMSVQIMHDQYARHQISFPLENVPVETLRDAFYEYVGYFGRYQLDEENHIVTHEVIASNKTEMINQSFQRAFQFEGDSILKLSNIQAESATQVEKVFRELVWKRCE